MVSLWHLFYGLLLSLTCIAYKQRQCWYFVWQLNGWRGLIQQPIMWILLICYVDPKRIMTSIQRFGKYFQFPLAIILFDRILLYVDDPVTMEGILTAPECLNKTFMQNGFFANKGLLHAKDQQWKERRKQLNPAFSHNTLTGFFVDFNRVASELEHKLKLDLQGNKISFQHLEDLANRAVLEVSCLTTMGVAIHFTQNDEKGIAWAYRYLMELTALRILKPWYQIDFLFRLLDKRKYETSQRANKLVQEFVANVVQQKHLEWLEKQQNQIGNLNGTCNVETTFTEHKVKETQNQKTAAIGNVPEQRIFIDQLFHLAEQGKLSLQDFMNESQSMGVVSFETVSTCIMNVLLCLAFNPDCQVKLRQEIKQVILNNVADTVSKLCQNNTGTEAKDGVHNTNYTVTMAHLQSMPYLDMILNESLRLMTTVPMNLRNVSKDFQLEVLQRHPDAKTIKDDSVKNRKGQHYCPRNKMVKVPKGTIIALDYFNMQRNEEFWGTNALKFHPEHFLKEQQMEDTETAAARRHPYAFIPFSKGLRTCIGYRYSIYLSKILLIKLIASFDFTTNIQFKDLEYYEGVSLKYRNSKDIHFDVFQVAE